VRGRSKTQFWSLNHDSRGAQTIIMRNAAGKPTGAVFRALRYLGKDGVDAEIVARLARTIDANTRRAVAQLSS
jgi:hypothetical protein